MNNFIFKNPTKLIFGKGTIACIAKELPADAVVMMTYGGGSIQKNGIYDQVKEALKDHTVIEFRGIEANPQYETLMKAVVLARQKKIDCLLAVGGGSVIDGTKFIAAAIHFNGDPWDILVKGARIKDTIPFGTVLTLPATGSEMNNGAVISRGETGEKFAFHNPEGYPRFSVMDPETCYSLPLRQISNGIVDSFIHVCEQYMTYPSNAMIQDRFCEGVLLSLIELSVPLMKGSKDYDVMANFMLSATMALNGFISMGVPQDWSTHMIGHELTALYGLDHAATLGIVYPAMLKVMRKEKHDKLLQYAARVWNITAGTPDGIIDEAIRKTDDFFRSVGIPTSLHEYGITEEAVQKVTDRFIQRKSVFGERLEVTPDKVREALTLAL